MSERPVTIANVAMRYAPVMAKLRRMPVLGRLVHFAAQAAIPGDTLVWTCVELGPIQKTWIALNPRTGTTTLPRKDSVELQALLGQLKPGMTFYDLGANFGCYSLLAASLVGDSGAVFSFEPDPVNYQRLVANLERNGFRQARAEQKAVSDKTGTIRFRMAEKNQSLDRGTGYILCGGPEEIGGSIEVECVTLDEFCTTHARPDVIKCDVEGAELKVLVGPTIYCAPGIRSFFANCTVPRCTTA